jgi:pimeloyl-ACP methyl ester carboxylesterase
VSGLRAERVQIPTGVHVRLVRGGAESAPLVVLVHGWGIHSFLWRRTLPALIGAGYRVLAVDLPGHGLSDRPDLPGSYSLEMMTAHLAAVFESQRIGRAHLVAQSMGGRIALEYARSKGEHVQSLTLFGSVGFGTVPRVVRLAPRLPVPRGAGATLLVRRWMVALSEAYVYGTRAAPDPACVDEFWAPTQFPDFAPAMRQVLIEFDWRPVDAAVLSGVKSPALVVFGTRDRTVRPVYAEQLVPAFPRGRLYWVRDAGHVATEEAYDEVNPLLLDFIGAHGQGAR